jgi:hypothetical protein
MIHEMVTIESKRWDEIPNGLELKARLEPGNRDADWLDEHHAELVANYPDEFVVVYDRSVVAHDPDLYKAVEQAEAAGVPTNWAMVMFLPSKPKILLL